MAQPSAFFWEGEVMAPLTRVYESGQLRCDECDALYAVTPPVDEDEVCPKCGGELVEQVDADEDEDEED